VPYRLLNGALGSGRWEPSDFVVFFFFTQNSLFPTLNSILFYISI
jgi:hypothetical protein